MTTKGASGWDYAAVEFEMAALQRMRKDEHLWRRWALSGVIVGLLAGCGGSAEEGAGSGSRALEIAAPPFTLDAAQEVLKCYFTSLPSDDPIDIQRILSSMNSASHHMILFFSDAQNRPDGTFEDCDMQFNGGNTARAFPLPLYLTQESEGSLEMPAGVAMQLRGRQPLMLQLHYLNASKEPMEAKAKLSLVRATGSFERASLFATYNTQIAVPPHGSQEVSGACAPPPGAQFFRMTTHAHKLMTFARVDRQRGTELADELVYNTDWEHPETVTWAPPYLTFAADERLHYACGYQNGGDAVVREGQSAATNEMCMAIGYYFPSSRASICFDSTTFTF